MFDPWSDIKASPVRRNGFQDHDSAAHAKSRFDALGWDWDAYISLTTIRNPWDRVVSSYHYGLKNQWSAFASAAAAARDFTEFVNHDDVMQLFRRQFNIKAFAFDHSGKRLVKHIIRLEDLPSQLPVVVEEIGLPQIRIKHHNRTMRRSDYRQYYDDHSRELVREILREDVEIGEYRF